MTASVGGTSLIIAILFWLAHRRWKPLLWLLVLLALVLAGTLGLGGLFFGRINVVSMGFAAILLGLAVDYAVIHYQEALTHPNLSIPEIRRAIAPSIFWAAVTTISAFLVLNFGGLPGLAQLGSLVGMGVALAACVMIFAYLPPLFPDRRRPKADKLKNDLSAHNLPEQAPESPKAPRPRPGSRFVGFATLFLLIGSGVILSRGLPGVDATANALRPRRSAAYSTLDQIQSHLGQKREPLWVIAQGTNETQVAQLLDETQLVLAQAVSNNVISSFTLPVMLWPRPDYQARNRAVALELADRREALHAAAHAGGFTETSLALTDTLLKTWREAGSSTNVFWPGNALSTWIFNKVTSRDASGVHALGFIYPKSPTPAPAEISSLESALPHNGIWLSGWGLLGSAVFSIVRQNMWKLLVPMLVLVLLSLLSAFRRLTEVLLSIGTLILSALCLLSVMRLAGWSWNLLNLMAIPLVLGTGVDYSLFTLLALRRHHGDLGLTYRSVGRALLLCGGTAVAGFSSLALSTNAGMSSLGQVCAVGIAWNALISVFLLPSVWKACSRRQPAKEDYALEQDAVQSRLSAPSTLYR